MNKMRFGFILIVFSMISAFVVLYSVLAIFADSIGASYGLFITANIFSNEIIKVSGLVLIAALCTAIIPSVAVYPSALHG